MSTKTTFKRVALVAVAALGLGVISVAPSQAAVIGLTATPVNGTATTAVSDSSTAATLQVRFFAQTAAADTVTVVFAQNSIPTDAVMTSVKMVVLDTATATSVTTVSGLAENASDSATATTPVIITGGTNNTYAAAKFGVFIDGTTGIKAGTYGLTAIVTPYTAGAAGTAVTQSIDIVVSAAAADSEVSSAATSTAFLSAGNSSADSTQVSDSAVAVVATASSADIAEIRVILKNAAGTASKVVESVTATISGPGIIGLDGGTSYGKSIRLAYDAAASLTLGVRSDGTAGTGVITISTPSVTFAAKKVTFYASAAATIAASANKPVIGSGAQTSVVYAKAVDSNGNAWGGTAYIYASSAADALIAGSQTPSACTYVASDDVHACSVSGTTAGTAKFKIIDAATVATATATSNEVSVRVSTSTPATVKLAFDKATYAPGEKAQIWVTALDADGLALPASTISGFFATGGITTSVALGANSDTLTATSITLEGATSATDGTVAGYAIYTVYMPFASGDLKITATGGTGIAAAGRVAVSATTSIVNASADEATDAANEATDAANAATDAALQAADDAAAASAAVAKLSKSVNKALKALKKQITALTALVNKLL